MKYLILFTIGFAMLFVSQELYAQNSRESKPTVAQLSPNTTANQSKKSKVFKGFLKKHKSNSLAEYEKLMKSNKKKYSKMQKGMERPKYSDPTYFGHKKPPKKRPAHKRKFCQECGMIH